MKLDEFYKTIDDIFLYTGNLEELNQTPYKRNHFRRMPLKSSRQFLHGVIIPTEQEVREQVGTLASIVYNEAFDDGTTYEQEDLDEFIEVIFEGFFKNEEFQNMDIRMKAKKIGANGLIHVQYYAESRLQSEYSPMFANTKFWLYSGVPVKEINP